MPFNILGGNWPNCLIKEGIQQPERWSESWSDDLPSSEELPSSFHRATSLHHHRCHHVTPLHHHHHHYYVTPLPPMYNPIIILPLSYLCISPSSLRCRLNLNSSKIISGGDLLGASGVRLFGRFINRSLAGKGGGAGSASSDPQGNYEEKNK